MDSLTALCSSGGCAAKYDGTLLEALLKVIPRTAHPNLLVGLDPPDDAAVIRLDDTTALVFTVDFFPPIVDDPWEYGSIAANNALNDVYAMGGTPALALSIAAFPDDMNIETAAAIVEGAASQCHAAGAVLAGGHTIRDVEPKFGLAAAGFVAVDAIWHKSGAQLGDTLLLTKPLGTGLVVTGRRRDMVSDPELQVTKDWMLRSNRSSAEVLRRRRPHAVTDITGFGLLGHAAEMARTSGVGLVIELSRLPLVAGADRLARAGVRTSGDERNRRLIDETLDIGEGVDEALLAIALDPQTAGGLLIALPSEDVDEVERALREAGACATSVGWVVPGTAIAVVP